MEDENGEGRSRSKRMKIKRGGRRRWRRRRTRRRGDEGEWNPGVWTDDPTAPGMTWTDRRQGRIRPDQCFLIYSSISKHSRFVKI